MVTSSPRASSGPFKTPPPIRGPASPCSPATRHLRTPSEPSPLRNVSFSAVDSPSEDVPAENDSTSRKVPLQGRSNVNRAGKLPVDPSDIAAFLGLKPTAFRSVSASSYDSDKTVRGNRGRNSPRDSPHNSPCSSPRTSSSRIKRYADDKENTGDGSAPSFASHAQHKRKISSVQSPQVNPRETARRVESNSPSDLPQATSVSTPDGTFGTYPAFPFPTMPAWLQDPSVVDVLAQLADEAQDPPSPSTSYASSTWAAILKSRDSIKLNTAPTSTKDVFNSPKSTCTSLFEEKEGATPPERGFPSPAKRSSAVTMEVSPTLSRSPRSLRIAMGQTTPTILEADEEGPDGSCGKPDKVVPMSILSPTKYARREATALPSSVQSQPWSSSTPSPKTVAAQWIAATAHMGYPNESALSASMAALTLKNVPVDPDLCEGDVTLVCRGEKGYIGFKADSQIILTYFNNFPVLSQTVGVTHVPLRESPRDVKIFLRFAKSQSINFGMTASDVLAIHRMYNLYDATETARLTLAFWTYHNPVLLCESLGLSPNRLELMSLMRFAADVHSVEIWRTVIDLLKRGWWRNDLDPHRMTPFDVAVMGTSSYRALQFLAGHPGHVWDNLQECSVSRDRSGTFCMSRVSLTGYCTFVDSTL